MLVRYINRDRSSYNSDELYSTIYKVVQFISEERGGSQTYSVTVAIVIPMYDKDWNTFDKDRRVHYNNINHKKIYTFKVDDLEIIQEHEIPESIRRDSKLDYLLR